jgi:hypothetical protein
MPSLKKTDPSTTRTAPLLLGNNFVSSTKIYLSRQREGVLLSLLSAEILKTYCCF